MVEYKENILLLFLRVHLKIAIKHICTAALLYIYRYINIRTAKFLNA